MLHWSLCVLLELLALGQFSVMCRILLLKSLLTA